MQKRKKPRLEVDRWQVVENVVAALERVAGQATGWTVVQNAMVQQRRSTKRRQVDVYASCPSGPRTFRVGIDVKNEGHPLDIEVVEQLCAKGKKLELDRYVIVSTSGFTQPAADEAAEAGVVAIRLDQVAELELFSSTSVIVREAAVKHVDLDCDEENRPPAEILDSIWIEYEVACSTIRRLAEVYAVQMLNQKPDIEPGSLQIVRVLNEPRSWSKMHAAGKEWPPPSSMEIIWTLVQRTVEGQRFRSHDGQPIFAALLPVDGESRQVTLVGLPNDDGSCRLAISVGEAKPGRTPV